MAKKNYYAVKQGKVPGIYRTWDACKAQVHGYPGAIYKGFERLEEAEAFLEDCLAVVADNLDDVRAYMEEEGMDVEEMSDAELEEQSEVFALPDGQYLIVMG
jgi:viroplasmin and RNaseH domain-containing protein